MLQPIATIVVGVVWWRMFCHAKEKAEKGYARKLRDKNILIVTL